jgi:hypothetical protein
MGTSPCSSFQTNDSNSSGQPQLTLLPTTAHNARTIRANRGYARPEKQTVEARSPHGNLASDEETAGSIRPPRRGFPPANLFSHRLPNLMVMSDFGRRMGATMSARVRPDAVIVAAGRFLASPDISPFGHPLPGAPCVVVIEVAVRTASRSAGATPQTAVILVVARRYSFGLLNFAAHSPEDSQRDRKCRSARLERTVPKGLFQYRSAAPRALSSSSGVAQRDAGIVAWTF